MTVRRVSDFLTSQGDQKLIHLVRKSAQLQQINAHLATLLEPALVSHCYVAHWRESCLVLHADTGVWATKLQYQLPSLLIQLRQYPACAAIGSLCCVVRPAYQQSVASSVKVQRHLGPIARAALNTLASSLPDSQLQTAINQLLKE